MFLVDESPILLAGLRSILQTNRQFRVVSETHDPRLGVEICHKIQPDVIVTDIIFDGMASLDHLLALRRDLPRIPVLVLTGARDPILGEQAIRTGARGLLYKQDAASLIPTALKSILSGGIFANDQVRNRLLESFRRTGATRSKRRSELSHCERNVLTLLSQGLNTRQIAKKLEIHPKTVQSFYRRIKFKLQLHSFADLLRCATLRQQQL